MALLHRISHFVVSVHRDALALISTSPITCALILLALAVRLSLLLFVSVFIPIPLSTHVLGLGAVSSTQIDRHTGVAVALCLLSRLVISVCLVTTCPVHRLHNFLTLSFLLLFLSSFSLTSSICFAARFA